MRIVAVSDLHGHLPEIPPCDLLLVAGDVCPDVIGGRPVRAQPAIQAEWFDQHVRPWLAKVSATHKIATWGNHDWCGQACSFDNDRPEAAPSTRLQILVDGRARLEGAERSADGTRADQVVIWGTPWSNQFLDWAFMKSPADLARVYSAIPTGIDILLSHQPPYGHGDHRYDAVRERFEHLGSWELLAAVHRVTPKLVVCGHIHSGHGQYGTRGIPIYNVSVVDEEYRMVHAPTVIDLP